MKKLFTAAALIVFTFTISAQTVTIKYTGSKIITPEKLSQLPEAIQKIALTKQEYILTCSNNQSEYRKNGDVDRQKPIAVEIRTSVISQNGEQFYYKDYANNKMLFEISNGTDVFQGDDKLIDWNWQITNETKTIAGYKCYKATSSNLNIDFTAWFTKDLTTSAGPDKFDGLPGTILYASTPFYEYTATVVEKSKQDTPIEKPVFKGETHTFAEMVAISQKEVQRLKTPSAEITRKEGKSTIVEKTEVYSF